MIAFNQHIDWIRLKIFKTMWSNCDINLDLLLVLFKALIFLFTYIWLYIHIERYGQEIYGLETQNFHMLIMNAWSYKNQCLYSIIVKQWSKYWENRRVKNQSWQTAGMAHRLRLKRHSAAESFENNIKWKQEQNDFE